jgi:hypothetical protein
MIPEFAISKRRSLISKITESKGAINYIIDADDYWYPTFLEEMFERINSFPDIKVFSAAIEIETSKTYFQHTMQ